MVTKADGYCWKNGGSSAAGGDVTAVVGGVLEGRRLPGCWGEGDDRMGEGGKGGEGGGGMIDSESREVTPFCDGVDVADAALGGDDAV